MFRTSTLVPLCGLTLLLSGCGGSGGGGSKDATLRIDPVTPTVVTEGTQTFTAYRSNTSQRVLWSVEGGDANGKISSDGTYTAPATAGTYRVIATLRGDSSVTAAASVSVVPPISVALTNEVDNPVVIPRSKVTLKATVPGDASNAVTWSVQEGVGSVASDGTFTAPDTPGTYHVVATSRAFSTRTTSFPITVVSNAQVRIAWRDKGEIVLAMRRDKAPNTVANFVTLVNHGFYDGIVIHRDGAGTPGTDPDPGIVQFGDPLTKTLPLTDSTIGSGGPGYTIPFEPGDLENVKYSLGMARQSAPDTAGSQVFINLRDNPGFNQGYNGGYGYVVFGAVTSGQDVVDRLVKGDTIVTARAEAVP